MQVKITTPAKNNLKQLITFYKLYIPEEKATDILNSILEKAASLTTFPSRGCLEENLKDTSFEYRYLLQGNCKIIYRIENDTVYITDFFDIRQDPSKLDKRKS